MRRFLKHFSDGRRAIYMAIDDGEAEHTRVAVWRAEEDCARFVVAVSYAGIGRERAKRAALSVAAQLALTPTLDAQELARRAVASMRREAEESTGLTAAHASS